MYIMLWNLSGRVLKISLGIQSGLGDLPLNRFWRHVLYMIIVNDVAREGCGVYFILFLFLIVLV